MADDPLLDLFGGGSGGGGDPLADIFGGQPDPSFSQNPLTPREPGRLLGTLGVTKTDQPLTADEERLRAASAPTEAELRLADIKARSKQKARDAANAAEKASETNVGGGAFGGQAAALAHLGEGVSHGWDSALASMRAGRSDFDSLFSTLTPEETAARDADLAKADDEIAQAPGGPLSWLGQQVGMVAGSVYSSGKKALETAGAGAAVGGSGGSVPGAIAGATVGLAAGFGYDSFRVNAGQIAGDLDRARGPNGERIADDDKMAASMIGGGIMAALDVFSFKVLTAPLTAPLRRALAGEVAKQLTAKLAAREGALTYAKSLGAETITETTQQVVQDVAEDLAKHNSADDFKTIFNSPERRAQVVSNAVNTAVSVAAGMTVVGLPGAVIEARGARKPDVPLTEEDHASPIPDDVIQQGKNLLRDGLEARNPPESAGIHDNLPKDIIKGLVDRGIPEHVARGAAAGVVAESGNNHTIVNTDSGATGLGQWLGSRRDELIRRYGPNPTRAQQIDFLAYELKGGDAGGAAVLAATDEHSALDAYIRKFMRPAAGHETDSDIARGTAALGGGPVAQSGTGAVAGVDSGTDEAVQKVEADQASIADEIKRITGEDVTAFEPGQRVQVHQGDQSNVGTVQEVYGQGDQQGVKIAHDNGTTFDENIAQAKSYGARFTHPPVAAIEATGSPQVGVPEAAQPVQFRGEPIDDKWTRFHADAGSLGLSRTEMPQIKGTDRPALISFLAERGIDSVRDEVSPNELKPTQGEFSDEKAASWDKGNIKSEGRDVLVSSDGYILDGHHQWVKAIETGEKLNVVRLDAPIRELIATTKEFPGARMSEGAATEVLKSEKGKADNVDLTNFRANAAQTYKTEPERAEFVEGGKLSFAGKALPSDASPAAKAGWENGQRILRRDFPGADLTTTRPTGPRVMVNLVGRDGKTDAERGHPLPKREAIKAEAAKRYQGSKMREAFEAGALGEAPGKLPKPARDAFNAGDRWLVEHNKAPRASESTAPERATADAGVSVTQEPLADQPTEAPINESTAEAIRAKAEPHQEELVALGKLFEADYGFINPGLKSAARIIEKLEKEGYESLDEIKDVARVGFKIEDRNQATDIWVRFTRRFNGHAGNVKAEITDKGWRMVDGDYFDRKLTVTWEDGTKAEIQIIPAPLEEFRHAGGGAELYTQWRSTEAGPEKDALLHQMQDGYAKAAAGTSWESFFNELKSASGNVLEASASESGAPGVVANPGAGRQTAAEDQTTAQGLPETAPEATSRSSTSNKENSATATDVGSAPQVGNVPNYGATNRVFTAAKAEAARKLVREKLRTQVSSGFDPEFAMAGMQIAGFHIEAGVRKFAALSKALADDLGVELARLKPYIAAWYNGARDLLEGQGEDVSDMDGAGAVRAAVGMIPDTSLPTSVDGIGEQGANDATTETGTREPDRTGDAGQGTGNAPGTVDQRNAGEGSVEPGRNGEGQLLDGGEPGQRAGVAGEPQADRPGSGERNNAGDGGSRPRSARSSRRVRTGADGTNFRAAPGRLKREGGWLATANRNLDIIELVNTLEAEKRPATPDEQALLAKWTGWGASEMRNKLFSSVDRRSMTINQPYGESEWSAVINRARDLIKGPDLETALQSTQYAHFTSETVIRGMWDAMQRMGFEGGRILEPGMGIGHFFTAAPDSVAEHSTYTGIEFDAFTARIAKLLLPEENIIEGDYTKQALPDGFFDVAIGNPPFSSTKILNDPAYKRQRFNLHNYFFAKSLDKVRPGGLLAFVTSRYTMDSLDEKARQFMAERADLVGAIRLPETAFKENAGTEVVTDVLFFQRRAPGAEAAGEQWTATKQVSIGGVKKAINEYFAEHPEMVLGRHVLTRGMYREDDLTVEPFASKGSLDKQFGEAVAKLPEGIFTEAPKVAKEAAQAKTFERDFAPASSKEGGLYAKDGKVLVLDRGSGVPVEALFDTVKKNDHVWLKGYIKLRDLLKEAQKAQLQDDADWETKLNALRKEYAKFTKAHGRVMDFTAYDRTTKDEDGEESTVTYRRFKWDRLLFDVESPLVQSLERITDAGDIEDGPFLKGRTLNKPSRPKIETVEDALAVTLDEIGRLDLDYVGKLLGKSPDEVVRLLGDQVYQSPAGEWQTADEYLSGNVLQKLEEAQQAAATAPEFQRNVQALINVQPAPLTYDRITVKLGAPWLRPETVQQFAADELGEANVPISYDRTTAHWNVEGAKQRFRRDITKDFGTDDRSPLELLEALLNNRTIKVTRTETVDGSKKTYTDANATAAAVEAGKKIEQRFRSWLWEDAARTTEYVDTYNRSYNNLAPRRFNGDHLTLPGLSANIVPHPHVKRAVWRIIQTGNTYLAHAVGAGKTFEQIMAGMEMRRLGLIKKPIYAVPNHMLRQFSQEFLQAYPAANIMVADERAFHTGNRRRFLAQASLNDPDAIILTHSSFGKIDTSEDMRAAIIDQMVSELEDSMQEAKDAGEARHLVSRIEKQIEQLKRRFEGKTGTGKDKLLTFDEMGVDFLFVDEAHEFRKLDFATNRVAKGIDSTGSARALDLFIKSQWLEQRNPGRSMVMASGTPVTNTMAELYTVMRYLGLKDLEKDGISAFDAWANMFGEVAPGYERNAAGGYEIVERFSKFVNVPELMKRVRNFMDVLTSNELGDLVKRPKINGGGPQNVIAPVSDALEAFMKGTLEARLKTSREWKPSREQPGNPDPVINIITDARLASIDMRFVSVGRKSDPTTKLNQMITKIAEVHKATAGIVYPDKSGGKQPRKGAAQIVFSPVGFGAQVALNRGFDVRGWIDSELIRQGVKKSEIGWMSDANTHAKKDQLQKDVRAGKVRILIGSPKNMGTGLNVQDRLIALHFLAPPWYPADVTQPHGRIERQGNLNDAIDMFWYATEGTYDSTGWGMVARKQKFIDDAMSGDDSVRTLEDISEINMFEMAAALAAGDDRVIRIAELGGEVERLTRLKGAHASTQRNLRSDIQTLEGFELPRLEKRQAELKAANEARGTGFQPFEVTVGGDKIDAHGEAGKALVEAAQKVIDSSVAPDRTEIGKLYGKHSIFIAPVRGELQFELQIGPVSFPLGYTFRSLDEFGESGAQVGLSRRIEMASQRIPSELQDIAKSIASAKQQLEASRRKFGGPFPDEQQLSEAVAEQARLQGEMAAETAAKNAPKTDGTTGPLASAAGPEMGRRDFLKGAAAVAGGFMFNGKLYATPAGLQALLAGTTTHPIPAEQAALWLSNNSANPTFKRFAAKIAPLVRGVKLRSVEFREVGRMGGGEALYAGFYDGSDVGDDVPSDMSLGVAHGIMTTAANGEDQIWLAKTSKERELDGWNERTVIHELLHAAVIRYYGMLSIRAPNPRAFLVSEGLDREAFPRSDKAAQAIEQIRTIWKEAVQRWKDQGEGFTIDPGGEKNMSAKAARITNGLQNTDEFIAYALADSDLQSFLREIPTRQQDERSLWQRFVDAIRSLFGVAMESRSAVDDVLDAANALLDEVSGQQAVPPGSKNRDSAADLKDTSAPIAPATPDFGGESEARWQEAKKGIGSGPNAIEKAKAWWQDLAAGFTRHWRDLPNEPRFSDVAQQLRKLEAAPEAAMDASLRYLRSLVSKMDAKEYDLFARKVVLDDLSWDAGEGRDLPFGFTPSTLLAARRDIDAQVNLNPKLVKAIRERKAHNHAVAEDMVRSGVLTREQIKNPAYFRHMVLDYARNEAALARSPSKVKSPYWAKRMGSTLDINANLLEAELDWLQKAQVDIATANTIEWIKASELNTRDTLRQRARAENKAALEEALKHNPAARKEDGWFRSNIARGLKLVIDEIDGGTLDPIPPRLQQAADDLSNGRRDGEPPFALFAWMLDNDKPGAMGAGMALKYSGLRKQWMRKLLGDAYAEPDDVAGLVRRYKPEGVVAWQPKEGRHLFTAKTITEHALDMFVSKLADTATPGLDRAELAQALGSVRQQLVVGGDRYTMALPEELAATLDEFGDRRGEGMVARVFGGIQGAWKRWVLINPRRFFKYNINNMTGDLDAIIAGNPGTLGHVRQAWTMLRAAGKGNADPRYTEALERGVFTAGLSHQEIPDINRFSEFRHLTEKPTLRPDKLALRGVAGIWRALQDSTQFRESLFRLAAYLDYVEKLEAGTPQSKVGYGASVPRLVDAVADPKDRAALLARDLVGDYGAISVAGSWLRRYLVPFWSWTEINTRRYWRLTSNAFGQSHAKGIAVGGLLGAGIAARTATGLFIRMGMIYGLIYAWNHLLWPDEEEELGENQRQQLHLILGRDNDGNIITLRTQGALSDVLGEFGFLDAMAAIKKYQEGQGSIGSVVTSIAKGPANKTLSSTSPIFNEPMEQALGLELWPDIFSPRVIHDRWRHLFQTVNLDNEYDHFANKPTRGYGRSWTESVVYRRDPSEMAYDDARGIAYDWLERVKGQEAVSATSARSEALRDYRLALRYGDKDAADKALATYESLGGNRKGLKSSIKRAHPLGPIAKKDRKAFLDSLTDDQLETFAEAEDYWKRTYAGE